MELKMQQEPATNYLSGGWVRVLFLIFLSHSSGASLVVLSNFDIHVHQYKQYSELVLLLSAFNMENLLIGTFPENCK